MGPAKRTLAIVAFTTTTLVSCASPKAPATTSTAPPQKVRIYATTAVYPLAVDLVAAYSGSVVLLESDVQSGNFASMMGQVLEDEAGYLLTTYLPADSKLWAAPVATDGIAIITHPDVLVRNLTTDELRAIYQGRITNWEQLGGADRDIVVFGREEGSGTRGQFQHMVMGRRVMIASALLAVSSEQMMERVATTPGSLGYVAWSMVDDTVQSIEVDGIVPSAETIAASVYPLRVTIYFAAPHEPNIKVMAFFKWAQSLEGQDIVGQQYVPFNMPGSD